MDALTSLMGESFVQTLGWTLIHSLWQGAAAALLLAIALRLMRNRSSNARYLFACAMLGATVAAGAITYARERVEKPVVALERIIPMAPPIERITKPQAAVAAPARIEADIVVPLRGVMSGVVWAWMCGVVLLSIWHVMGWMWLQRLRRGTKMKLNVAALAQRVGVMRPVRLIECGHIDVPAVTGALRPVILMPIGVLNGLSLAQVESLLIHELAHIRRHDYLVNLLQTAVETLLFYHPAVWWISSQIRQERENSCDDIAVQLCGDAVGYAEALAALEQLRPLPGKISLAASGGRLIDRIRRLLHVAPAPRGRMRSLAAAVLAIACICAPIIATHLQRPANAAPLASTSAPAVDDEFDKATPVQPDDLVATETAYKIGVNDLLLFSLHNLAGPGVETIKSVRIAKNGAVSLPKINAIKLVGLTVGEAEKAVVKAYADAKFTVTAGVTVNEIRSQTFSILGDVKRPGQYAMTRGDMRLSDALAFAEAVPTQFHRVFVIRKTGNETRIIAASTRVMDDDKANNLVIRAGDMLIVPPNKPLRVVVGKEGMTLKGNAIDRDGVKKILAEMTPSQRQTTYLEVAAAPDAPVARVDEAKGQMAGLVQELDLAYLSNVGIEQPATQLTTRNAEHVQGDKNTLESLRRLQMEALTVKMELGNLKAEGLGPAHKQVIALEDRLRTIKQKLAPLEPFAETPDQYYIDGAVPRPGAYSLNGEKITIKQAIAAAGGIDRNSQERFITLTRRDNARISEIIDEVSFSDFREQRQRDVYLQPYDVLRVSRERRPLAVPRSTTQAASNTSVTYYITGAIARGGAYNIAGRKITVNQALAAAGGLQKDVKEAFVRITRREGDDERVVVDAALSEFIDGANKDFFVNASDLIEVSGRTHTEDPATKPAAPNWSKLLDSKS